MAWNVESLDPLVKTKVPPLVVTGESVHRSRDPVPPIGPIAVSISQVANAALVGPLNKSRPDDPARENPTPRLAVSATSVMVNAALAKGVPPADAKVNTNTVVLF